MYLSMPALITLMWFMSRSAQDQDATFDALGSVLKPIVVIAGFVTVFGGLLLALLVMMAWSQERVEEPWQHPNDRIVTVTAIRQIDRVTNDTTIISVARMNQMASTEDYQRFDFEAITK